MKHFNNRNNKLLLVSVVVVSLFGCGASSDLVAGSSKPDASMLEDVGGKVVSKNVVSEKMKKKDQVEFAKKHLADKLSIDMSAISLAGAESVTWSSGAMGCPKPGMNYTQALVPGMLIMLKAGNQAYRYHASSDGSPSYCPNSRAESPSASPGDI